MKKTPKKQAVQAPFSAPAAPTPPPPAKKPLLPPQTALIQAEIAARVLAKRHLIPFTKRFNPKYKDGWVHRDICRRLERFSREVAEGKSPRLMLLMPPRHGKLLADSTPVLTPQGWMTHGDLRPGDMVFSPSGSPIKVLAVASPNMASLEVVTTEGVVKCHPDHEWTVYDRSRGAWRTVETRYLATQTLRSGPKGARGGRYRFQLPARAALVCEPQQLPTSPYLLGLWLGDGKAADGSFCFAEQDRVVYQAAVNEGYSPSWSTVHKDTAVNYVGSKTFTRVLKQLGVLNDKHIPEQFLRGSVEQRLELMAGLIDTDGHVEQRTGRVRVVTCSPKLRDGVVELARSLGWAPYVHTQAPATSTSGVVGRQDVYYVGFQPTQAIPSRVPRKVVTRFAPQRRSAVLEVRAAVPETGRCIQVDSPDGLYLAGKELIPTHNSELASRSFPAWHLGHHPDHEFIACSYNIDLARSFSRKVKQIIEDPLYASVFPATRLDPDNASNEAWGLFNERGGYVAAGVGGGITGRGAHCLVIDDPVKNAEEADSSDNREKIWEWYLSTAYSRLAPGGGVLIIQTWWHDDDLAGRLQTLMKTGSDDEYIDQFEVIKYPAIAEADEYLNTVSDRLEYDLPADQASAPTYSLLRKKGEALHAERYDLNKLLRIKAQNNGGRWWSALYQQNPVPDDGGYFTKDQFRQQPAPNKDKCNVLIAWDFAISEKKQNDYTVGTVGLQDDNDMLHIVDQLRFKSGDAFFIVEAILNLALKWYSSANPSLVIGFEDGQIYRAIEALLKKRMRERQFYPSTVVLKPITDKLARGRVLQGRMQQGMVSFASNAPWFDSLKTEMLRFPAGAHDDQVDSASWMAQLAVGKAAPAKPSTSTPGSWRDKLNSYGQGATTHMVA